eukprot:jgi/Chlat1/4772/Chrsp308S04743
MVKAQADGVAAAAEAASQGAVLVDSFLWLVVSQLCSRFFTFLLNLLVARHLSQEDYGVASIQFHLLTTSLLFLSREGFRRSCLRVNLNMKSPPEEFARVANVAYLSIPFGGVMAASTCFMIAYWQKLQLADPYLVAIVLHGLVMYGYGQLAFACALLFCYSAYFLHNALVLHNRPSLSNLLPAPTKQQPAGKGRYQLDGNLLAFAGWFTVQAGEKLVLTEGEKLVLVLVESRYNQGVYGLVSNLGQSIDQARQRESARILTLLLKLMLIFGLIFVTFGRGYSYTLLRLLYGSKWSDTDAPYVLAWYCCYVLAMAINGITEAFVHAVASQEQLKRINVWLVAFSITHVITSCLLITWAGAAGLIVANCLNMAWRVVYSLNFTKRFYEGSNAFSAMSSIPAAPVLLCLASSFVVTQVSERTLLNKKEFYTTAAMHMGVGVGCMSLLCAAVWKYERAFLQQVVALKRKKD